MPTAGQQPAFCAVTAPFTGHRECGPFQLRVRRAETLSSSTRPGQQSRVWQLEGPCSQPHPLPPPDRPTLGESLSRSGSPGPTLRSRAEWVRKLGSRSLTFSPARQAWGLMGPGQEEEGPAAAPRAAVERAGLGGLWNNPSGHPGLSQDQQGCRRTRLGGQAEPWLWAKVGGWGGDFRGTAPDTLCPETGRSSASPTAQVWGHGRQR